jgi:hypothetical protein
MPLADFGRVDFTGASATTTDGHTGSISDSEWRAEAVSLDSSGGQAGVTSYGG